MARDLTTYLKKINETLETEELTPEDLSILMTNVWAEISGKAVTVMQNQSGSRALERVIEKSTDSQVINMLKSACNDEKELLELFSHCNASHVLQQALPALARQVKAAYGAKKIEDAEDDTDDEAVALLSRLVKIVLENWAPLFADPYGSHLVRDLLALLRGEQNFRPSKNSEGKDKDKEKKEKKHKHKLKLGNPGDEDGDVLLVKVEIDHLEPFRPALAKLAKLVVSPNSQEGDESKSGAEIRELGCHPTASATIQALLETLSVWGRRLSRELSDTICGLLIWGEAEQQLLDELALDPDLGSGDLKALEVDKPVRKHVRKLMRDPHGSRLIETIIRVAPESIIRAFIPRHVLKHMALLACDPNANFVVQRLLAKSDDPKLIELCLTALTPALPQLLKESRGGVVQTLLEAVLRLKRKRKPAFAAVMTALETNARADQDQNNEKDEDEASKKPSRNIVEMLLDPASDPSRPHRRLRLSLVGALLLQTLLRFPADQAAKLDQSFLSVPPERLLDFAMDPIGSRTLEAFLTGPSTLPAKQQFIEKFKSKFAQLGCGVYGSFFVQKAFACADLPRRTQIARELMREEAKIGSTLIGKTLLHKCQIEQFKRERTAWIARQRAHERTLTLFAEIVPSAPAGAKRKSQSDDGGLKPQFKVPKPNSDAPDVLQQIMGKLGYGKRADGKKPKKTKSE